ncbi:hypothetical protein [Polaromonas sp.]|uniref:hypothetical protein n=1 Tax=Polaromonas sp. TaxID=1869339 RepID=UPI00352AA38A
MLAKSIPQPYPGGITEVLVDIAEALANTYAYPGDSRDRYALLWQWSCEFESKYFQARIAAGGAPGETYIEDVEEFALKRASDAGWQKIAPYLPPGVEQICRADIVFEPPTSWVEGESALTFGKLIEHLEASGVEDVTITRLLWRGRTPTSVRMRVEAGGEGAAQRVTDSCDRMRQKLVDAGGKLCSPVISPVVAEVEDVSEPAPSFS